MRGNDAERRLRAYKNGDEKLPYDIWRKVLVATERVPQEIEPVIAFMRGEVVKVSYSFTEVINKI